MTFFSTNMTHNYELRRIRTVCNSTLFIYVEYVAIQRAKWIKSNAMQWTNRNSLVRHQLRNEFVSISQCDIKKTTGKPIEIIRRTSISVKIHLLFSLKGWKQHSQLPIYLAVSVYFHRMFQFQFCCFHYFGWLWCDRGGFNSCECYKFHSQVWTLFCMNKKANTHECFARVHLFSKRGYTCNQNQCEYSNVYGCHCEGLNWFLLNSLRMFGSAHKYQNSLQL